MICANNRKKCSGMSALDHFCGGLIVCDAGNLRVKIAAEM